MEGIWEIVHDRESAAKFIVTDEPVTFFNRAIFPAEAPYPGGGDFPKIATRTLFPLSKEALYPEKQIGAASWSKLDDDWFLLPNPWKVGFTGGFAMGFKDGRTFAMDEYGRRPGHPHYENKKQQDKEFRTFHNGQQEWAKKRFRKRLSRVVNRAVRDDG